MAFARRHPPRILKSRSRVVRTPGLIIPNDVIYQLIYTPNYFIFFLIYIHLEIYLLYEFFYFLFHLLSNKFHIENCHESTKCSQSQVPDSNRASSDQVRYAILFTTHSRKLIGNRFQNIFQNKTDPIFKSSVLIRYQFSTQGGIRTHNPFKAIVSKTMMYFQFHHSGK